MITRMHSSRMHTVRCSGRLMIGEGCLPRVGCLLRVGVCPGGVCPVGCVHLPMSAWERASARRGVHLPPVDIQTPVKTTVADGNRAKALKS